MAKNNNETGIIRSNSHDINWLFALGAAVRTLDKAREELGDRIDVSGQRETAERLYTEIDDMFHSLLLTYPPEKYPSILRQMQSIFYRIDTVRPVNADKAHTLMDVDDLSVLIKFAHRMNCQICSHPTWCGSRCDLGKTFDRCCPEHRGKKESWSEIDVTRDI